MIQSPQGTGASVLAPDTPDPPAWTELGDSGVAVRPDYPNGYLLRREDGTLVRCMTDREGNYVARDGADVWRKDGVWIQSSSAGGHRRAGARRPRETRARGGNGSTRPASAEQPASPPVGASSYPWPDPADITSPSAPEPYPLELFPDAARAAIDEYAAFGQQPLPLVASSALAQMALAAQGLADVARNEHLVSPCSLYLLTVALSGERKSAADKQFGRAVRAWVRNERENRLDEYRRSEAMAADHNSRMEGVKTRIKRLASKEDEESLKELERLQARLIELKQNPIVPKPLPTAAHEDVNPASLAHAVGSGWPSSGLFSDEAGAVIGAQGLADESATSLLSLLNILWDARDFIPTRKQAEVVPVRGRRFSCFLMLQPALLPKLIDKGARVVF